VRILPITNTDYRQRTNFGNKQTLVSRVIKNTAPNIGKTTAEIGGAVMVLAAITGAKAKSDNTLDNFQIKDLTDEEFEEKKAEIIAKKDEFRPFRYLRDDMFTKWNVQLFDYMYQDCKGLTSDYPTHKDLEKENNLALYKGFMRLQCDHQYRIPIETKDQAEVVLKMMKMPWFFASDGKGDYAFALNNAGYDIEGKKSAEIRNVKLKILDELEKNREKYETPTYNQMKNISEMIAEVSTYRGLNIALKMIRHPELLEADQCDLRVSDFFKKVSSDKERAKISSDIIDKLIKNPELFKKEDFNHALTYMLTYPNNNYKKELVLNFLDNPALFDYEDFVYNMPGIISDFPSSNSIADSKIRKDVFETLQYYKQHPELLKNQEPYNYPDFVYALISYCEPPDMDCPEWPISDKVLDTFKENPDLFEDDEW